MRDLVDVEALRGSRVLVLGCGGVGSLVADFLVRCAVGGFSLWDCDRADLSNLGRSIYTIHDWKRLKALALEEHLKAANPLVRTVAFEGDLLTCPASMLVKLARQHQAALVAADDFRVHERINAELHSIIPLVFGFVLDNGNGGEILRTDPQEPGCLRCLTNFEERRRARTSADFQSLGLGFLRVAVEAAAVVLGILLRGRKGGDLFQAYVESTAHLFVLVSQQSDGLAETLPAGFLSGVIRVVTTDSDRSCSICNKV